MAIGVCVLAALVAALDQAQSVSREHSSVGSAVRTIAYLPCHVLSPSNGTGVTGWSAERIIHPTNDTETVRGADPTPTLAC